MINLFKFDLRFGDPVLSLSLNKDCLLFGTAFGMLSAYEIHSKSLHVFSELAEEAISASLLSPNSTVYFAVGDYYCAKISPPLCNKDFKIINYEDPHSEEDCAKNICLVRGHSCFLISTCGKSVTELDLIDGRTVHHDPIPPDSVFLDLVADKILILQYQTSGARSFLHFCFRTGIVEEVFKVSRAYGHVTDVKMFRNGVAFIHNSSCLKVVDYRQEEIEVYSTKDCIVTYGLWEDKEVWCGLAEKGGKIVVFKDWVKVFEGMFNQEELEEKVFELEYPYFLALHYPMIAVATEFRIYLMRVQEYDKNQLRLEE